MIRQYIQTAYAILSKPSQVSQRPIHIQIEPTTYCNLNCRACGRSKYTNHLGHLSPEVFTSILDQIRPFKVSLSGSGEPLMNPDIFDLLALAKQYGSSINTTTNCTLFTPDRCIQLIKSGIDLVKISIDGASAETYRKIRGEDRFEDVKEGIRTLCATKTRLRSVTPYIRFNYVISKQNYQDMAQTIEMAHQLGVDAIYFQPLQLFGIEERSDDLIGELTWAEVRQELRHALSMSQRCHIQTNLPGLFRTLALYWQGYQMQHPPEEQRVCLLPWFSVYITSDGFVRPCCTCVQDETNMGKLSQESFEAIWNGAKYQAFRQAIRAGKRPFAVCQACIPRTLMDFAGYSRILPGFLK